MSKRTESRGTTDDETAHVDGLEEGAGCTEIWEHLSERRAGPD